MEEVIVVGAGIGGLYMTTLLSQASISFKCLEGAQRVGGIIDQISYQKKLIAKGPRIFLVRRCTQLLELAQSCGVPYKVLTHKLPRYILSAQGLKKVGPALFVKYPELLKLFIKKHKNTEESISEFFQRVCSLEMKEELIDPLCRGIWAAGPEELSMDHLLTGLKKGSLFKRVFSKKKGLVIFPEGLRPLLKHLEPKEIFFNHKVIKLEFLESSVRVHTNQGVFESKKVVLSTPFHETRRLLAHSGVILDPILQKGLHSDLEVVSFYFHRKQKRPYGSGYLIPKARGMKTLGVLFDADMMGYTEGDLLSCFVKSSKDPIACAYQELQTLFPEIEPYEKAFRFSYPEGIFQCAPGVFDPLKTLQASLEKRGVYLVGAYPKVGVADVLDKSSEVFKALKQLLF